MAALETALGVRLLDRDGAGAGAGVRPTAKGRELLGHARRVLRATEALVDAAGTGAGDDGAVLRLGVTGLVAHVWLHEYLRALRTARPGLVVEVGVDLAWRLSRELFAGSLDLALHNGPFDRETTGNVSLGAWPLVWTAAPDVAAALGPAPSAQALAGVPLLVPARDTRPHEQIAAHFAGHRGLGARLVPGNDLDVCRRLAVDGAGVASLPVAMLRRELAAGTLVLVDHGWRPDDLVFRARHDAERAPAFVVAAAALAGEVAARHIGGQTVP